MIESMRNRILIFFVITLSLVVQAVFANVVPLPMDTTKVDAQWKTEGDTLTSSLQNDKSSEFVKDEEGYVPTISYTDIPRE